jgi:hypothetical protein
LWLKFFYIKLYIYRYINKTENVLCYQSAAVVPNALVLSPVSLTQICMKIVRMFSSAAAILFLVLGLSGPMIVQAAGPAAVNLGTASNFVILAKTGISSTGSTSIVGDLGISPAAATYITGLALTLPAGGAYSTSAQVTGKVYAPGYMDPTPVNLTTAVSNMQTAYTEAAGRTNPTATELGAGNIGGLTIAPGLYKWSSSVSIPTDVTLSGSASDVWIFQIAQNLNISSGKRIVLSGGAQAGNVFWIVAGQTTIGTTAVFNGNILDQTAIVLNTGAQLNGRALAQTAVTLDANMVTVASVTASTPVVTPAPTSTTPTTSTTSTQVTVPTSTMTPTPTTYYPVACTQEAVQCPDGSYVGRTGSNCEFAQCPQVHIMTPAPSTMPPASVFGQEVRTIATSLTVGNRNNNVKILQEFLISQNKGPRARALAKVGATAYFGALTRMALAEFQATVGIHPAVGNFGPITRAYVSANY